MTDKKKAPLTPEESNRRDKQILDSLMEASMISLADSILAEWKAYLNGEGETILGQEVSFNRAILLQLQKAVSTREDTYRQLLVLVHEHTNQIVQLKKGYEDLCKAYDENKLLHLELGTRQKKHVETCDKNFLKLKEQVENLMRRL